MHGSTGGCWKRGSPVGHLRVPGRCAERGHHDDLVGTQPADQLLPRQRSTLHNPDLTRPNDAEKPFCSGKLGVAKPQVPPKRRALPTSSVHRVDPRFMVTTGGKGVVAHVGARLLCELADDLSLTEQLSVAIAPTKQRRRGLDRGEVLVDLAVTVADGATSISDLRVLSD